MKTIFNTCQPREEVLDGDLREHQFAASLAYLLRETNSRRFAMCWTVSAWARSSWMTDISEQIQSMAEEEAYYWFSKMTDHRVGRRSQKAMRILLARE